MVTDGRGQEPQEQGRPDLSEVVERWPAFHDELERVLIIASLLEALHRRGADLDLGIVQLCDEQLDGTFGFAQTGSKRRPGAGAYGVVPQDVGGVYADVLCPCRQSLGEQDARVPVERVIEARQEQLDQIRSLLEVDDVV